VWNGSRQYNRGFRVDGDGRELFADFAAICRRASFHSHEQVLPDEFRPERLVSADSVTAEALETRRECVDCYNRLILLHQVLGYAGAKLKFKPQDLGVSSADASELKRDLKRIKRKFAELCSRLERSCPSLMAHLAARLAARDGEIPESWLKTLTFLTDPEEKLNALIWAKETYSALVAQEQANPEHQPLQRELHLASLRVERALNEYESCFAGVPYDFSDTEGEPLSAHLSGLPESAGIGERGNVAVSRANDLYLNLLGRIAAEVEPQPVEKAQSSQGG
jgi:hypothetical protein